MVDSDEYEPYETVWEFLQSKGSVGLLALLYEKPRTYSELESEIEITSSTISRRRDDADHLGLLTVELESDDHGTKHVYTLTDMGYFLARRMAQEGITSSYHKMRDHQQTIEEKTEEVADWVKHNPEKLLHFPPGRKDRIKSRENTELPPELEEIRAAREDSDEETDASESQSTSESDSETESSPTVIRPDPSDEPPNNPDTKDDDPEMNTDADENQSQLTDSELQDRLEESGPSDESKDESMPDDE